MKEDKPEVRLESFLAKFTPGLAALAGAVLRKMRELLPGATQLVYDNYNALAIGFGPDDRTSDAIFSIAVYPRWVSLFFLQGAALEDPAGILQGAGNVVRYIRIGDPADLNSAPVRDLMARAMASARRPIDPGAAERLVIKSVSAKQRPRRPQ